MKTRSLHTALSNYAIAARFPLVKRTMRPKLQAMLVAMRHELAECSTPVYTITFEDRTATITVAGDVFTVKT